MNVKLKIIFCYLVSCYYYSPNICVFTFPHYFIKHILLSCLLHIQIQNDAQSNYYNAKGFALFL